jgi:hypothetical protein
VDGLDYYPISTVQSIKSIQTKYPEKFEQKSIAQELIQNSLNENQTGGLVLANNLIYVNIENLSSYEIEDLQERVNTGLSKARLYHDNKEERLRSLDTPQKHSKSHGRGFLLILLLGWDIITLSGKNCLLVAAVKH